MHQKSKRDIRQIIDLNSGGAEKSRTLEGTACGTPKAVSRRTFVRALGAAGIFACCPSVFASGSRFVHPGLLHTEADFDRMKQKVAANESPWVDGWNVLIANSHASLSWQPNPQPVIYRGSDGIHAENYAILYNDIAAAYACALRWMISGDRAYADKAVQIMNAWSGTLTEISGGQNGQYLAASLYGYQFANVGEIMRTYSGLTRTEFSSFQTMMLNVFYPLIGVPQGGSNIEVDLTIFSNWDLAAMAALLGIGVLCDKEQIFQDAINYFTAGLGNGAIAQTVYYLHPGYLGQTQESGRDQGHDTLSIALLGAFCEMAWNQGIDFYGYDNNRFLAGAEYVAKGNLIENGSTYYSVPFAPYSNEAVSYTVFSTSAQGNVRPEWALIYNHYVNRKGLAAPYSQKFATLIAPEGGGGNYGPNSGGYDQLGYGTLTCSLDPIKRGAPPSGLTAFASAGDVILSWWGTAYATSYTVKRSTTTGGPYKNIATGITDLLTYTDRGLPAGHYYYAVTAETPSGETAESNRAMVITATELQTYLKFDDGKGRTAVDSSGHQHKGTLVGGATWAKGLKGDAVSLNGSTGYVRLPADIVSELSDFTIASWVYWNAARTWERVFDFGANIDHYMMLTASSNAGPVRFAMSNNSGYGEEVIDGSAPLPTGQWVHVAVTLSGGAGTLYVNGNVVGTNTGMWFAPFRMGSTKQNWIGRSQYPGDPYFNGLIDEFRIYWGALTAEQVAGLASNQ